MAGFVCVYYGNTGSSWLLDGLATSDQVLVPGFEPVETWAWEAPVAERVEWIRTALSPPSDRDGPMYDAWVDSLRASPQVESAPEDRSFSVVGFKVGDMAISETDAVADVLVETRARVVFLTRSNRIKHALSLYRYHEEDKSQFELRGERPASKVNLKRFNHWVEESMRLHGEAVRVREIMVSRLGQERVMDVAYEEFITEEGKRHTLNRLCRFLEIDPVDNARSFFVKATSDDLASAVVNYRTLRLRYRLSPLRGDFSD